MRQDRLWGGARPKASVPDSNGELHIAKFPNASDAYDVPMWEYVVFQLAKLAGLNVPPVRLEKVNGRNVLLVRRFDRNKEARIPS